jgi:hypothetical protein
MALLLAACSSNPGGAAAASDSTGAAAATPSKNATAAPRQKVGGAAYVNSAGLPNQMATAPVTDPGLNNMVAVNMTIPRGWKLQGLEILAPCAPFPYPVFRAYSPDGLMQLRQEPLIGWNFGPGSNQSGCVNVPGVVSAADFLTYYLGTIKGGAHVVGPMRVPAAYSKAAQKAAEQFNQNSNIGPKILQLHHTADTAALRVQVVNGSFLVEERLRAAVQCGVRSASQPGGTCYAVVDVLSAPLGKLDALVQLADNNNLPRWTGNPTWGKALLQQLTERNQRIGQQILANGRAESQAASAMLYNAFQQNMTRSASEHAAFMQQQEASFQSSMNNANAAMNARSTAASDFVDYALDQQTVTGAGETTKVSSAYSQTWVNGQGQYYQTNLTNVNPNGVLAGNWTKATVVHGNGQPK